MQIEEAANALLSTASENETEFHRAYDAAIWFAVTSSRHELLEFANKLFDDPYMNLPAPLQVAIFRILGLESRQDTNAKEVALA